MEPTMLPLSKQDLYRLPWSLTDNPIGWLEITDICNLYCKGCYRQRIEGHKALAQIKEEIDFLRRVRNCDDISIAGGEPLLHPEIAEIIAYIRAKGLKAIMLTNGKALTEEKLVTLKKAGLTGITFHVDQMQERKHWEGKSELELFELRNSLLNMIRKAGRGLYVAFGCTVYKENFAYLPDIVSWARQNSDVVCGLVFITFRAVPVAEGVNYQVGGQTVNPQDVIYSSAKTDDISISSYDVWHKLHDSFGEWTSAAYLDGTHDHESIKWLITANLLFDKKSAGFVGAKALEFLQTRYHWRHGRYVAYEPSNKVAKTTVALAALFDGPMRKALGQVVPQLWNPWNWFRPYRVLTVGVVQAPDLLPNGECDMCDSCPDMTVYKGKLYRSCRLDEVRKFGGFMKPDKGLAAPAHPEMEPQRALGG